MFDTTTTTVLLAGLIGALLFGVVPALGKILDELKAIHQILFRLNQKIPDLPPRPDPLLYTEPEDE